MLEKYVREPGGDVLRPDCFDDNRFCADALGWAVTLQHDIVDILANVTPRSRYRGFG